MVKFFILALASDSAESAPAIRYVRISTNGMILSERRAKPRV